MGRNSVERALVVQWNAIVESGGISALAEAFRNSNPAFEGRATTGPQNYDQIPELAKRGRARAEAFFKDFDAHLDGREYVATGDFTFADITALVAVDFARMARVEISEELRNLQAWYAKISTRPSAGA